MNNQYFSVSGYPMSHKLYASFMKMNDTISQITPLCPTLILSISMTDFASKLLQEFSERTIITNKANGFIHVQEEPFWDRPWRWQSPKVEDSTVEWISNHQE